MTEKSQPDQTIWNRTHTISNDGNITARPDHLKHHRHCEEWQKDLKTKPHKSIKLMTIFLFLTKSEGKFSEMLLSNAQHVGQTLIKKVYKFYF